MLSSFVAAVMAVEPAGAAQPDLAAVSIQYVSPSDTVFYRYNVSGSEVMQPLLVMLWWATGPGAQNASAMAYFDILDSASDLTVGEHTKAIPPSYMWPQPAGTTHLLLLLDPGDQIPESDDPNDTNNTFALALGKDQTPPTITILGANPLVIECHAAFEDPGAVAMDNVDGQIPVVTDSTVDANEIGNYLITYTAKDSSGNSATNLRVVTVVDTTAPVIGPITVTPSVLWPPNHKMVDVVLNYTVSDNCEPAAGIVYKLAVESNQSANGLGDGNKSPDWEVVDAHHVRLRAERSGMSKGRVYTIYVTCTDSSGNAATSAAEVFVR